MCPEATHPRSESKFEPSAQPWAILHPNLLALAKAIQSHTLPEMTHFSLSEATKPREQAWPNTALRARERKNQ